MTTQIYARICWPMAETLAVAALELTAISWAIVSMAAAARLASSTDFSINLDCSRAVWALVPIWRATSFISDAEGVFFARGPALHSDGWLDPCPGGRNLAEARPKTISMRHPHSEYKPVQQK